MSADIVVGAANSTAPAMSDEIVAKVTNVSHKYGSTVSLDDVSIDIPARKMVGLIGPDGVGKSTLLGADRRRAQDPAGKVDGARRRHRRRAGSARGAGRIAYMPQGLGKNLYPTLSVFENIDFFGRLFGQSPSRARVAHRRTARRHRSATVPGPARRQAFGRHEAETRPVLRADPRSRPADPRRADHGRRPAVAPAVLGADRPHPRAPPAA